MKEGWEYKKLGEVCSKSRNIKWDIVSDTATYKYIDLTSVDRGDLCIHNPQTISKADAPSRAKQIVELGDVIFATTRPTLRRVSLIDDVFNGAICSTGFCVLRPNKDISSKWIFYGLQNNAFYNYIEPLQTGASYPAVTDSIVKAYTLPIPPLSEQQSIVDFIDSAFAKIDAMKANAEKSLYEAKALFQASLKEMLEPKEGWEVATIGKLGDIFGRIGFRGYTKNDLVAGPDEGAITLSPSNIQDGRMDYTSCTYISWFKYEESPEIMINNGDVLIVKTGSSYGKSAFVENLPHKATINPQSVVIKNIIINNKFFAYLMRTPWVLAKFDEFVSGTAIPTFSQAKLSQVELSYPSNDMQNKICEKLDSLKSKVDKLQENYNKISQECDALKQAILRQVFE